MRSAILVFMATICSVSPTIGGQQCPEISDDAEILEVVFTELIAPRLKEGVVLLTSDGDAPQFPATVSQVEQQRAIVERLEEQPQPEESEFAAAFFEIPRGTDLDLGGGRLIAEEMVDGAFAREGCELPLIKIDGLEILRFEYAEFPSPWDFWDSIREEHEPLGGLVGMALPSYSSNGTEAVVSYSRMHGPVGGMGETAYLRFVDGTWIIIWHETTFVS